MIWLVGFLGAVVVLLLLILLFMVVHIREITKASIRAVVRQQPFIDCLELWNRP